jgi:hypothetical protein
MRTDSAFASALPALLRGLHLLQVPTRFCTWWPTSCAIT